MIDLIVNTANKEHVYADLGGQRYGPIENVVHEAIQCAVFMHPEWTSMQIVFARKT